LVDGLASIYLLDFNRFGKTDRNSNQQGSTYHKQKEGPGKVIEIANEGKDGEEPE